MLCLCLGCGLFLTIALHIEVFECPRIDIAVSVPIRCHVSHVLRAFCDKFYYCFGFRQNYHGSSAGSTPCTSSSLPTRYHSTSARQFVPGGKFLHAARHHHRSALSSGPVKRACLQPRRGRTSACLPDESTLSRRQPAGNAGSGALCASDRCQHR